MPNPIEASLNRYGLPVCLGFTEDTFNASVSELEAHLVENPPLGCGAYWESADHVNYLHPQYLTLAQNRIIVKAVNLAAPGRI